MSVREYVGARYVPIIVGEWDNTKTYEPLMVVTNQGNSYTSRQYVPAGIEITNESYWVLSANYNAQVEAYRQEVRGILPYDETPTEGSTKGVTSDGIKKAIDTEIKKAIDTETTRATEAEQTLAAKNDTQDMMLAAIYPLDTVPTNGSTKGITSNGVYDYIVANSPSVFANVEAAKASDCVVGSTIMTEGYYSPNDFGAGLYKVAASGTDTTALDFTLDNGLVAKFVVTDSAIYANQFGAHGDGSTDDTTAIQAGVTYCAANKLTLKFAPQVYITSSPITLYTGSKLTGGMSNDEYQKEAIIKNTTTNFFTQNDDTEQVVGIKIFALCFIGSITAQNSMFASDTTLKWGEINSCGFRQFYRVFNNNILGERFYKLYVQQCYSLGTISGSDSTFADSFISTYAPMEDNLDCLSTNGLSLTRFTNIYFTCITSATTGSRDIVHLSGYSQNLVFDGCYFDFCFGRAIYCVGKDNNAPTSFVNNLTVKNCVFRDWGVSTGTVYNCFEFCMCRNVTIENNLFTNYGSYKTNTGAVIYNIGEYAQDVKIAHNEYLNVEYSANNDSSVQIFEPYYARNNRNGFGSSKELYQINGNAIGYVTYTGTTGGTYGEIVVPASTFNRTWNYSNPSDFLFIARVTGTSIAYFVNFNQNTGSGPQFIVRDSSGNAVTNKSVTLTVIIMGPTFKY